MENRHADLLAAAPPTPPRLLRPREVATLLAVDVRTVTRLIAAGHLPALRVGSRWRIHPDDLRDYVARASDARNADGPGSRPDRLADRAEGPAHATA